MKNLKELKRKYEELGKEIERLEKNKGRWRAEDKEYYYKVGDCGEVEYISEDLHDFDEFRYKTRNYFKTEEEAQTYLDNIKTYYELMDLAEELNGDEKIDWKDVNQIKYCIVYKNNEDRFFQYFYCVDNRIGNIYCLDKHFLEKAKERIGEERLIKLFRGE